MLEICFRAQSMFHPWLKKPFGVIRGYLPLVVANVTSGRKEGDIEQGSAPFLS